MGRVARAHGIRGRVLIAPYNADSEGLERVRRMWLGEREFEVERAERVHLGYLVAFRGVLDRDQAAAQPEPSVNSALIRPARRDDIAAIYLLYLRTTPSQVAAVEGPSLKTWQAGYAQGLVAGMGCAGLFFL